MDVCETAKYSIYHVPDNDKVETVKHKHKMKT